MQVLAVQSDIAFRIVYANTLFCLGCNLSFCGISIDLLAVIDHFSSRFKSWPNRDRGALGCIVAIGKLIYSRTRLHQEISI